MVAIYVNPEAFDTSKPTLMGRQSAGEGFFQAYLRHSRCEQFHFWNVAREEPKALETFLERFDLGGRPVNWIGGDEVGRLGEGGVVQMPSPRIGDYSWLRRPYGDGRFGLVGVTHTTATERIMDALASTLLCPIQPWDAIICTSRAVRASVAVLLDAMADHLKAQLGATRIRPPRLETIPLGVDTQRFAQDPEQRRAWREKLDIPEDAVVVLYVGRFSLTSKMNPVPMAMALERAAERTGRPVYWVLSGWASGEKNETRFHEYTKAHCPSVHYKIVDGRPPENRYSIWSVGDIFISLSDNIQETFGLTPVEAMAAGLPSVISDWDGYKDTVRHGVDGFRVSTYTPRAGRGADFAYKYEAHWDNYEAYVGQVAQFTAVDLEESVAALAQLIENPELRRSMGARAQRRAKDVFDWKHVIPAYEALWDELNAIRVKSGPPAAPQRNFAENPWALDPFRLFAAYPTEWVTAHTRVSLAPDLEVEEALLSLRKPMVAAGQPVLPAPATTRALISHLADHPHSRVHDVLARFPHELHRDVERGLVWLAKYGVVQIFGRSAGIID
jgi:glycosyltransferase involved in cell wall biosynthesis